MKVEKLIERFEALKIYMEIVKSLKDEYEIRIIEDVVLEEAFLMFDDEKVRKHNYFLISLKDEK